MRFRACLLTLFVIAIASFTLAQSGKEANARDVANIAKRAGLMLRGQWLPESEIQKRLAGIAAS